MSRLATSQRRRGFTLIEAMISIAILAMGLLGIMASIIASRQTLVKGQIRDYRAQLLNASTQRWMSGAKLPGQDSPTGLANQAQSIAACGTAVCTSIAVGSTPWAPDPTPVFPDPPTAGTPNDLSTGAYFMLSPNGELTHLTANTTPAVLAGTTCAAAIAAVPNLYCREILVTAGNASGTLAGNGPQYSPEAPSNATPTSTFPLAVNNLILPTANVITLWVRVAGPNDLNTGTAVASPTVAMSWIQ